VIRRQDDFNCQTSPNFLWFTISKRYTKATKDVYVCGLYIPPSSSKYFDPELFEELEKDVLNFSSQGSILSWATLTRGQENIQIVFVMAETTS